MAHAQAVRVKPLRTRSTVKRTESAMARYSAVCRHGTVNCIVNTDSNRFDCDSENAVPMTVVRLDDEFAPAVGLSKGYTDWTEKFSGSVRSLMAAVDHRQVKIPVCRTINK